jgi:hypothetical protein
MKRPLLWVIALLIAVAPALADVCRVDCERERPPECPLHQQAPHRCSHDHTIGSATLTRTIVDAQRPLVAAIVVTAPDAVLEPLAVDRSRVEHRQVPPLRSPRAIVLRI